MNDPEPTPNPDSRSDQILQTTGLQGVIRVDAAAIADAELGVIAPGSIVLRKSSSSLEVLASAHRSEMDQTALPLIDHTIELPDQLLMPGLINAHAHLDLTHIGIQPHDPDDGFVHWVDMIRAGRRSDPAEIADAVRLGISKLLRGGTAAVGDIAGAPAGQLTLAPFETLASSAIEGVSFLEFFGIGKSVQRTQTRLEAFIDDELPSITQERVRIGFQPHAPNTVDRSLYSFVAESARRLGIPICTHLAETPEEQQFVAHASGPQRALLEKLSVWDDSILDSIGQGKHPVAHLAPVLDQSPMLAAHVNDASDEAIELLAQTNTRVVYCPRASEYFGAQKYFGPHRYREMLSRGVPVCLGTDSIVNLDTSDRISVLDEMRLLSQRDGVEAELLLSMVLRHGSTALGLDPSRYSLAQGAHPASVLAVKVQEDSSDPWSEIMRDSCAPRWVFEPQMPTL